jgi:SP family arabinose:H+ symporter-like MFS transporter
MDPTSAPEGTQPHTGSVRYLYLPAAIAAIGGLLFGFDTAVINGAIVFLKRQLTLTDSQTEIGAIILLLGCVLGASVAAFTSDRFGRKRVLLAAAALFTASSIAAALPRNLTEFVIARLVGGLAVGLASTLSPLYIAEISPARIRGLLVSVNQLAIVTGILLSYSVNYALTGGRTGELALDVWFCGGPVDPLSVGFALRSGKPALACPKRTWLRKRARTCWTLPSANR